MKKIIRLTESDIHRMVADAVKKSLSEAKKSEITESFEDDFNSARDNFKGQLFGFEMKNHEGDWEYGEVDFDPKAMTMSCMGATINVDPDMTVDQNLQSLYDELVNRGFSDGE